MRGTATGLTAPCTGQRGRQHAPVVVVRTGLDRHAPDARLPQAGVDEQLRVLPVRRQADVVLVADDLAGLPLADRVLPLHRRVVDVDERVVVGPVEVREDAPAVVGGRDDLPVVGDLDVLARLDHRRDRRPCPGR